MRDTYGSNVGSIFRDVVMSRRHDLPLAAHESRCRLGHLSVIPRDCFGGGVSVCEPGAMCLSLAPLTSVGAICLPAMLSRMTAPSNTRPFTDSR